MTFFLQQVQLHNHSLSDFDCFSKASNRFRFQRVCEESECGVFGVDTNGAFVAVDEFSNLVIGFFVDFHNQVFSYC